MSCPFRLEMVARLRVSYSRVFAELGSSGAELCHGKAKKLTMGTCSLPERNGLNLFFTTRMVFPKTIKSMNSRSGLANKGLALEILPWGPRRRFGPWENPTVRIDSSDSFQGRHGVTVSQGAPQSQSGFCWMAEPGNPDPPCPKQTDQPSMVQSVCIGCANSLEGDNAKKPQVKRGL